MVVLTEDTRSVPLGRFLELLEDPSRSLTIEQAASAERDSAFRPSQADIPNLASTSSAYWIRFGLDNQARTTHDWVLQISFPSLNFVDLYLPAPDGEGYVVRRTGAFRPVETRDLRYPGFILEIPLEPQTRATIYVRVETATSVTLPLTVWQERAFADAIRQDSLLTGAFYGAILVMLVFNLMLYFSLRERAYLFLCLFLAAAFAAVASYEGWTEILLRLDQPWAKPVSLGLSLAAFGVAILLFANSFLLLKQSAPALRRILVGLAVSWGITATVAVVGTYAQMRMLVASFLLATAVFSLAAGWLLWRKGFKPARLYVIGWSGFALALVLEVLLRLGWVPDLPLWERLYRPGLLVLMTVWSLALADRVNLFRKEALDSSERLRQSESRLAQFLEAMPVGVAVYDSAGRLTYFNKQAASILAFRPPRLATDALTGRTITDLAHEYRFRIAGTDEPYPLARLPSFRALQGERASVDDVEADVGDRRVPLEVWGTPVTDPQGRVQFSIVAFDDITVRRSADEELRQFRLQLEGLVLTRTAALSEANRSLTQEIAERERLEQVIQWRLEWLAVFGRISQAMIRAGDLPQALQQAAEEAPRFARARLALIFAVDDEADRLRLEASSEPAGAARSQRNLPLPEDQPRRSSFFAGESLLLVAPVEAPSPFWTWLESQGVTALSLTPMRIQGALAGAIGLGVSLQTLEVDPADLAAHQAIAADLTQLIEKARLLKRAEQLMAEEARSVLARDLHDSVTQVLFSASLVADILPQIWKRDPDEAMRGLGELRRLNRAALSEMRTLLLELRPAAILSTSLNELVSQLVEAVTSRAEIGFALYLEPMPPLPGDVHIAFFRIAQEAINNVVKHSSATLVSLRLHAEPAFVSEELRAWEGRVELVVEDNGVGFDPGSGGTRGLEIMQERAREIGAELAIESTPGRGTRVRLAW